MDKPGMRQGSCSVLPGVERRRGEVLSPIEGALTIASEEPRNADQFIEHGKNDCGKDLSILFQEGADVVDREDFDPGRSQQLFQRDLPVPSSLLHRRLLHIPPPTIYKSIVGLLT